MEENRQENTEFKDWTFNDIDSWARKAKAPSRAAAWILASGVEASTEDLNARILEKTSPKCIESSSSSLGAIVGGIKAAATIRGLLSPLEDRISENGCRVYKMREELQQKFRLMLFTYPDIHAANFFGVLDKFGQVTQGVSE